MGANFQPGPPGAYFQNARTVRELLELYYGNPIVTEAAETYPTVGTNVVQIGQIVKTAITKNISNTGATNIAIGFNPELTLAQGVLLEPGGFLNLDWFYDGDLLDKPLFAVSSLANGTLYVCERVLSGV